MADLKSILEKKPIQIGLFFLWVGMILWVFVPHLIHHTPKFVDKKLIADCQKLGMIFKIKISNLGFIPKQINARRCDVVEITNIDQRYHQPAFGPHPIHLLYPRFIEKLLAPKEMNEFVLKAYGEYEIHDHLNDEQELELNISK